MALDAVVNQQGGHVRKTSTTLARMAKRRREEVREMMQAVLEARPFDALPDDMAPALAGVLRPISFKADQVLPLEEGLRSQAYVVLEGEVDVEIEGEHAITLGPGSLVGAQREVTDSRTDVQAQVKGGGLVDFFRYDYKEARTPAKTDYRVNVQFKSDMFDVESENRVYTVESRTEFAETTSEIIISEARELARRLRKDDMIR